MVYVKFVDNYSLCTLYLSLTKVLKAVGVYVMEHDLFILIYFIVHQSISIPLGSVGVKDQTRLYRRSKNVFFFRITFITFCSFIYIFEIMRKIKNVGEKQKVFFKKT